MSAQLYLFHPSAPLRAGGERLAKADVAIDRPLRWGAWHPDGSWCLLVGNGGTALRYNPGARTAQFDRIATGTKHNLRGAAFSPDGRQALLVGNQGAVLLYDGSSVLPLPSPTKENLRRAAWRPRSHRGRPQGDFALIVGNTGTVLRYQDGALTPVPGDRAHTLRALAWRPDGAYALVGAYASSYAGYPRPHALYKCDGLYLQALLASDQEDDFVAVDWHPQGGHALIIGYAYDGGAASNKLLTYDGAGFRYRPVEISSASGGGALLGAAWHPGGQYALLCGEGGALLRFDPSASLRAGGEQVEQLASGTKDNLVGPFWRPDGALGLLLRGPGERVYTV